MKASNFDYRRPANLEAAIVLMSDHDGDAMALAGGQSLMPMMNFRVANPEVLIDLADVAELRGISETEDAVRIGAMTRYVELTLDPIVQTHIPLFGRAIPHIAHDAIRNRGTIGGSIALADPAAEMPALMLVLGAKIEVAGPAGPRTIHADNFFEGYYETTLGADELIVAIHIPKAAPDQHFGFHELTQRHGDYALAGCAISSARDAHKIALFGVADRALRLPALEGALGPAPKADEIKAALDHLSEVEFADDMKASAATRQRLSGVAITRAFGGMTS